MKVKNKKTVFFIILIFLLLIIFAILGVKILNNPENNQNEYNAENEDNYNSQIEIEYDAETMEDIDALKKENKPVIVVFGADYCPSCVEYMDTVTNIAEKYKDKVIIKHIDTAKHKNIRKIYNIEIIPSTIIYYANGEAYKPVEDVNFSANKEETKERKYVSDDLKIVTGESLGLSNIFEYGQNKEGKIAYTKYVGTMSDFTLEDIIENLLK